MTVHWGSFEAMETVDLDTEPTFLSDLFFYALIFGLFQLVRFAEWLFAVSA